ncbi:MAG: hypothetical protein LBT00_07405 [Spirochaetaceae bacterium]|nr:hypothetical protein [Spirochaetaceae bacterium]
MRGGGNMPTTKQSRRERALTLDCFASLAMTGRSEPRRGRPCPGADRGPDMGWITCEICTGNEL